MAIKFGSADHVKFRTEQMAFDATEAIDRIEAIERALTKPGLTKVASVGAAAIRRDTNRAFATQTDPNTGVAWAPRKYDYEWPMLRHTGTLKASTRATGKALDHVAYIAARVAEASMIGGWRQGSSSYHMIAGAVYFGRKRARSYKGSKLKTVAATGTTPPRPFAGLSKSSMRTVRRYAERLLRK